MNTGSFCPQVAAQIRTSDALKGELEAICGGAGMLLVHEQVPWASITFSGTRHRMTFGFEGALDVARGEELIALLPDHEFEISGQLVADAAVTRIEHKLPHHLKVDIELLLLDEE